MDGDIEFQDDFTLEDCTLASKLSLGGLAEGKLKLKIKEGGVNVKARGCIGYENARFCEQVGVTSDGRFRIHGQSFSI